MNTEINTEEKNANETVPEAEAVNTTQAAPRVVDSALVEKTIRKSVYVSMGTAFVPIMVFDIVALTAVNLNLTRQLSKLYGVEFKEDIARKIILSAAGTSVSLIVTPALETLLNRIPVVGGYYAICSVPLMFGGCTYAVGRMFVNHFERGGNFMNASIDVMKNDFSTAFKSSREWLGNAVKGKKKEEIQAI